MLTEKQFREEDIDDLERTIILLGDIAKRFSFYGDTDISSNLRANIASLKTSITITKKRYGISANLQTKDNGDTK